MPQGATVHYLDNASTTRVLPAAAALAGEVLQNVWANPASLYRAGLDAEKCIDLARGQLAAALGCRAGQVVFTAGGTEANNIALWGAAAARAAWGAHIVTTGYEHPSAALPAAAIAKSAGAALTEIMPGAGGDVDVRSIAEAVTPKTMLVSAMQVNNETGAVIDVSALASAVKAKNPRCFVHVDGVQGFCKQPVALRDTAIDSYAASGHKLHAPKGVGALYLRAGAAILPPMLGGGQERGIRPGTPNTAYIAAFGEAVRAAARDSGQSAARAALLRGRLLRGLEAMGGVTVHSPPGASPYILFFSMPRGLKSQVMLNWLDESRGVCVSSGSACGRGEASRTLRAMGVPAWQADTAIRASFCAQNTEEDVDALLEGLMEGAARLARA